MEDDDPDPQVVIDDAIDKFKKTIESTQESLMTLRIGRADPRLLDRVAVEYYGVPTPLNQLASVTVPTSSQLAVDVYDKSAVADVERALYESDIGMTPSNDGKVIRLNVPQLTEDRRKELAKTAKQLGEEGKVSIRNVRKSALDKIKKMKKAIGEDAMKNGEADVQKAVKTYEDEIAKMVSSREKEIITL
jgi:ribosome recycling factor